MKRNILPYDGGNIKKSRELRKEMTRHEKHLWYDFLRNHQVKWRRQYQIGNYIVDFYSKDKKLAIELDGSQHYTSEGLEYDKERQKYIEQFGIKILRFTNLQIDRDFENICRVIDIEASNR